MMELNQLTTKASQPKQRGKTLWWVLLLVADSFTQKTYLLEKLEEAIPRSVHLTKAR